MRRLTLILSLVVFTICALSANAAETKMKKWTLLIFINADNNLNSAGIEDVTEMQKIGSTDDVNIIAMLDLAGNGGTKTYYVEKHSGGSITSPVIRDMPEQDMGDLNTLVDFAKFGIDNYPAEHYLVAIWNHGAGWQKSNAANELIKGISYDDDSHHHMTTPQLGEAVKQIAQHLGRKVDIIAYDACLMQMAEVAAEVKDHALIEVASEETEPGDGWPYDDFCGSLVADPDMNPAELATVMVDAYDASYAGGSQGSSNGTQSAVNLAKFDTFLEKLDAFSLALYNNGHLTSVYKQAISASQAFYYSQYKDLGDFIKQVLDRTDQQDVVSSGQELLDYLKNEIVINSKYNGSALSGSTGLSIYIPTKSQLDDNLEAYRELIFADACHWDEFLQGIYYPNYPVLAVGAVDVVEEIDGAVNPGDKISLIVKIKNDGMKPGKNLTVSVGSNDGHVSILGGSVTVDEAPAMSTVDAPAIEVRIAADCPVDTTIPFSVKIVDADGNVIPGTAKVFVKEKFEMASDVLLLVVDKTDKFTKLYKKALEDAGIGFDLYDLSYFGDATLPLLKHYVNGMVVFNAPDTGDIDKVNLDVLAAYLQAGGNLFITGQDIGYKIKNEAFYADYLHAEYVQDNTGIHDINGDVNFSIAGGSGANNQKWPDEINPLAPAQAIFTYEGAKHSEMASDNVRTDHYRGINGSGTAGLFVDTGAYKVVYFAFGFEGISESADRAAVMGHVAGLLMPTLDGRIAGIKALAEQNKVLYNSGSAAQATARRAEEHWLNITKSFVSSDSDKARVKAAGLRQLLRRVNGAR